MKPRTSRLTLAALLLLMGACEKKEAATSEKAAAPPQKVTPAASEPPGAPPGGVEASPAVSKPAPAGAVAAEEKSAGQPVDAQPAAQPADPPAADEKPQDAKPVAVASDAEKAVPSAVSVASPPGSTDESGGAAASAPPAKPGDLPAPPDVGAAPADAEKTASGLASRVLQAGTGQVRPSPTDSVEVHYTGWTTDGKMFDSSVKRGKPITFPLNRVIAGWTEGVGLMVEGEKRRLWIPEELAYKGRPGAPQGMLVFDVELIAIQRAPEAPADVAAPPADADKTASGLASRVLTAGTGDRKPAPTDQVRVHYTGWTTDGKMFDSSVSRGQPATFPLNRVIAGWTEGVGLMVKGEKRRLWIPEELAYKGKPGAPQGMLVFDVELIEILE